VLNRSFIYSAVLALSAAFALPALAGPETFYTTNNTTVDGSDGSVWAAPNNYIGNPYQTTGMSVTQTGSSATLNYYTAFSGTDSVNGYNIGYADIFFGSTAGSGYAISLGDETMNGGVATAGVYQIGSGNSLTSQQVWGGRSGIVFGSGYNGGFAANTVVTGGNFLEGVTITDTLMANGLYDLAITIDNLPFDVVQDFENGTLTAYWGTGDCNNGGFAAIPEPVSFWLMIFGVSMVAFVSWRKGAPNENAYIPT
jgi:hypothetical protein